MYAREFIKDKTGFDFSHPTQKVNLTVDEAMNVIAHYNQFSVGENANNINSSVSFLVNYNDTYVTAHLSLEKDGDFYSVVVCFYDPNGGNLPSLEIGDEKDFYKALVECASNISSNRFWDMELEKWLPKTQLAHVCYGARYSEEGYKLAGSPKMYGLD